MRLDRLAAVLATLLVVAGVGAQTTATLVGTVTVAGTPTGGVSVTLTSQNMLGPKAALTDSNGHYVFGAIPPGQYRVRFELEGAQTLTRVLDVGLGMTSRADADLKIMKSQEAITVTAAAPSALETNEIQTNFNARLIEQLPLLRGLIAIANLAPGVNQNGPGRATVISGGFSFDSTYYVDGAVVNEVLRGQPNALFIEDAIQETTVQTGAISAEFGRFTGGVVAAVTKSGGNEFGGSLRDNLRNARWTAQGALDDPRPDDRIEHIYEGTLGGRIVRDRIWFFTAGLYNDFVVQSLFGAALLPGSANQHETPTPYTSTFRQGRAELKLSGQLSARQNLVGTYFRVDRKHTNVSFDTLPLEQKHLDSHGELPNTFSSVAYSGTFSPRFLLEGLLSRQDFTFVGTGADAPASPERGTNIRFLNAPNNTSYGGYPTFCSACGSNEERDNRYGKLKGNYYLSTARAGTHSLAFGYENFEDRRKSDNNQSASDFTVWVYPTSFTTGAANRGPERVAGELRGTMVSGAGLIIWWPILQSARGNAFTSQSLFVNDRWDWNDRFSFNVGVRYDRNDGRDNGGLETARDDNISPRVGVTVDPYANGRFRLNASYSTYASKINNGIGDSASGAGVPSYLYWVYAGPDIVNVNTDEMLDRIFGWFRGQGFIDNKEFLLGGGTAGLTTQIPERLQTPAVDEVTFGAGMQGSRGSVRVDYQHRQWNNFYTRHIDQSTGKIFDLLAQREVDIGIVENSDEHERSYDAVLVQGAFRPLKRIQLGGNYTWSRLRGNVEGETAGGGPGTTNGSVYPEFTAFPQNNPIGYLNADQRHKARAWASCDIPSVLGNLNISVLQRFDSGLPYSAMAQINPRLRPGCPTCIDPATGGYTFPPTGVDYFFSERGAFRTDDIHNTDVALNYSVPFGHAELFAQGEVVNAFNRQGSVATNTLINANIRAFNPMTEIAVECPQGLTGAQCRAQFPVAAGQPNFGIWQKGPSFGRPLLPTTGATQLQVGTGFGHFQIPRSYRVSVGVKF